MTFFTVLKRGFCRVCPQCGKVPLFCGYLKVNSGTCSNCGLLFDRIRSDDAPAYFTILIVGHIILPAAVMVETHYTLSLLAHLFLWFPLTIGFCLLLLPFIKGAIMALIWWFKRVKK